MDSILFAYAPAVSPTAREIRSRILEAGGSEEAADLAVKATAPARHRTRVEATYRAALAWGEDVTHDPDRGDPVQHGHLHAALLLALDAIGEGGDVEGGSEPTSARLTAFARLGKGRRGASDGGAWMAASACAFERIRSDVWSLAKLPADEDTDTPGWGDIATMMVLKLYPARTEDGKPALGAVWDDKYDRHPSYGEAILADPTDPDDPFHEAKGCIARLARWAISATCYPERRAHGGGPPWDNVRASLDLFDLPYWAALALAAESAPTTTEEANNG